MIFTKKINQIGVSYCWSPMARHDGKGKTIETAKASVVSGD